MIRARAFTAALLCCGLAAVGCAARAFNPGEVGPIPRPIVPPDQAAIRAAIERGVAFLVDDQNSNGSWGTSRQKMHVIVMPVPGGHMTMTAAVTALCVMALIEADSDQPGAAAALRRGEDWLIENVPKVRQCSRTIMYNNWAHAYAVEALVKMFQREPPGSPRREKIRATVEEQLARLTRYQHVQGGWGYYSWSGNRLGAGVPRTAETMNFTTGSVLIAMHDARQAGFSIPDAVPQKAVRVLRESRRPDFAYPYSPRARNYPMFELSTPPASLARSQVCNVAARLWGDEKVTLKVIKAWLNRLFARNDWLSMARKQVFPHQGYMQIAAYFYYYGHYYAARGIDLLPPEERPHFQGHLAHILLAKQEKDGAWWDFPCFNYHQQWGTAFAVMSLTRCLPPETPPRPERR